MENTLQYKGFFTNIAYSAEDMVLHGKIEGIDDLVTFESESPLEIEKEFHAAVDDYLEHCKEIGKDPAKTYRGTFNVRIDPKLHRAIAIEAMNKGISLNQAVERAIGQFVNSKNDSATANHNR
ncbi:MAG: type II toxin-antitoxin system HicB family antitoxin [Clostridia bacterium]|nr:type II toxin-antitoxin system HicB family antitoxin [Clostridia bacterium]